MDKMKTYLLYVRQYSIFANDYVLKVYKVVTDSIYRIIGKMYCEALEHIKRIDYSPWAKEKEKYWKNEGYEIRIYKEPRLSED